MSPPLTNSRFILVFAILVVIVSGSQANLCNEGLLASFERSDVQGVRKQAEQYEVMMYEGVARESLPKKDRKKLSKEKPLLITTVDAEGKSRATQNEAMFEGMLEILRSGKVEIKIKKSQLNSSSGAPISAIVKLTQPISPSGYAFDSIVFSYYFRVRSRSDSTEDG